AQLKKRFPGRKWGRQVLRQVLRNVAYIGDLVWCRRPHDHQEAKVRRVRDRSEWVVVPDAFPPLITRALFERVQETIDRNKRDLRAKEGGYPLSGLLRCATCGEPYIGAGGPVGPEGDRDRYRFYRCRGGERGICPGRLGTLQARHIEPLVLDCISDEFGKPHTQKMLARWVDDLLRKRTSGGKSREKALRAQRRDVERAIERVVQAIARGTLTDVEAAPELTAQRKLLADVDRAISEDKLTAAQVQNLEATRERWLALVRDFGTLARGMRPALLRQTLRTLGVSGSVHKTRRRLDLAIPGVPKDLAEEFSALSVPPGRGSR
ncbi:MAG TPA: recombinase family protein, partial [Gemmatimonadales bacterium]|nr:recombinase family protein [Gemmatimonadales bacterium]